MKKIAVVLFNLGGPDSLESVEPFLFNLFNDKAIINLPNPIRWLIAKIISKKRAPLSKEIYKNIGNKSPIIEETKQQALALSERLSANKNNFKIFYSMRYWHPLSNEIVKEIKGFNPDELLLLPLYPQFSTTTTDSSINDFIKEIQKVGFNIPIKAVCCYPTEDNFIDAHISLIKEVYIKANSVDKPRILFSAHGLPEKIIDKGDPYVWQVNQTVNKIIERLKIEDLDWKITYQSRVGPLKWVKPFTDEEITKAGKEGKNLIIVPIAFVSEHSETLVELDIEYLHLAKEAGVPNYFRVPTLSTNKLFIDSLAKICHDLAELEDKNKIIIVSDTKERICPKEFCKCINNYKR